MHYKIFVIGEDYDKELAPFDWDLDKDDPENKKHLVFCRYKNKYTETAEVIEGFVEAVRAGEAIDDIFSFVQNDGYTVKDTSLITKSNTFYAKLAEKIYDRYDGKVPDDIDVDFNGLVFGTWRNPQSFWEWYVLGGRFFNAFKLKEGKRGKKGTISLITNTQETLELFKDPTYCDSCKKGDVDWEKMYQQRVEKYSKLYDEFEERYAKSEKFKKGEHRRYDSGYPKDFHPYMEYYISNKDKDPKARHFVPQTKEQYMAENALMYNCYGILFEGKYYSREIKDEFGDYKGEVSLEEWAKTATEVMSKVPDDATISSIDCHN